MSDRPNHYPSERTTTLDDLRVPCEHGEYVWHRGPADTREPIWTCAGGHSLTPAEFDRIAREWLREKIGDTETMKTHIFGGCLVVDKQCVEATRIVLAVLAALDGGQE